MRPLQLARVTVALYPSVGDVVSISAHLGACVRVARVCGSCGQAKVSIGSELISMTASLSFTTGTRCGLQVHIVRKPQQLLLATLSVTA